MKTCREILGLLCIVAAFFFGIAGAVCSCIAALFEKAERELSGL